MDIINSKFIVTLPCLTKTPQYLYTSVMKGVVLANGGIDLYAIAIYFIIKLRMALITG